MSKTKHFPIDSPQAVKGALIAKYGALRTASIRLGINYASLSHVLHGYGSYPNVVEVVSKDLGISEDILKEPAHV